jgi:hypothetical protein
MSAVAVEKGPAKRVRLWNDLKPNIDPSTGADLSIFNYEILGSRYIIKPGEYIELARRTAITVRGFYPGKNIKVNLRVEPIEGDYEEAKPEALKDVHKEKVVVYSCMKCDAEFSSKGELSDHMKMQHTPGRKVVKTESEKE